MGKQGFEMAAQVCTADDILWTKFLLLLPKLLYSRRNNHSNDCANLEMGDNWRKVLFKTIVEIVKNKLTSILSLKFKKIHEAGTKGRQICYTKEVARILWLKLRMNLYFADNCKVGFISSRYVPTIWLSDRQPIKVLKPLNDRQLEFLWKFNKLRGYTIQIIMCRWGTAMWSLSDS